MKVKVISLSLLLILFCSYQTLLGQYTVKDILKEIRQVKVVKEWQKDITNNSIKYTLTDTMVLCSYPISPVRRDRIPALRSYKLELRFENNWSRARIKEVKIANAKILVKIKKRIIAYCESINWATKTNEEWINERPLDFVFLVNDWTHQEKKALDRIKLVPNFIYKGVGIFADVNTICLITESKEKMAKELFSKLEVFGIKRHLLGWHNKKY